MMLKQLLFALLVALVAISTAYAEPRERRQINLGVPGLLNANVGGQGECRQRIDSFDCLFVFA